MADEEERAASVLLSAASKKTPRSKTDLKKPSVGSRLTESVTVDGSDEETYLPK